MTVTLPVIGCFVVIVVGLDVVVDVVVVVVVVVVFLVVVVWWFVTRAKTFGSGLRGLRHFTHSVLHTRGHLKPGDKPKNRSMHLWE